MIREHAKAGHSVEKMCAIYQVSRSGYYKWESESESIRAMRARKRAELLEKIRTIFHEYRGRYGSARIHRVLVKRGVRVSRKRVAALMKVAGLVARHRRKYKVTTDSSHGYEVAPNLLCGDFSVGYRDMTWLSDITYIPTEDGWLYLAATMDLYSRKIVGWSMDRTMTKGLVCDALEMGIKRRNPGRGLLHHSDRGVQYASGAFREMLRKHGIVCSMSRKGNCWDNAPMESFFRTLKTELVRGSRFRSRDEARKAIYEYIEIFYNRYRLHSSLGYMPPEEFEYRTLSLSLVA